MTTHASSDALRARVAALAAAATGRTVRAIDELPPGLGARRFLRVHLEGADPAAVVARVEPDAAPRDPLAAEPPLEPIRALLEAHGLPVPRRIGADEAMGIELIEDVGDTSLERAVASAGPSERVALYREAVALVPRLQAVTGDPRSVAAFGRRLDAALIASKARKWLEWTLPFALGRPASDGERALATRAFERIAGIVSAAPQRLAHRDFKAANLHLAPRGDGARRLVMIDLQGAFLAPPEYDLVCLLRDSHVALPEAEVEAHLDHVRPSLPDRPGAEAFADRFDLLTVARVAKDLSHYVDAAVHRADDRYLRFVPTGARNLRAAAARAAARHPEMSEFAEEIDAISRALERRVAEAASGGPACAP